MSVCEVNRQGENYLWNRSIFVNQIFLIDFLVHSLPLAEKTVNKDLRCYECNSHDDEDCLKADPGAKYIKKCNQDGGSKFTLCRKIYQIIEFSVNGCKFVILSKFKSGFTTFVRISVPANTRIIRSCGHVEGNYTNKCYQRSGFGGRQEVCACQTDQCNAASSMKATFGILLASIVIFISRI